MIRAWILYYSAIDGTIRFEERDGPAFDNTNPLDWGLGKEDDIMLVLQHASFLGAWIEGRRKR